MTVTTQENIKPTSSNRTVGYPECDQIFSDICSCLIGDHAFAVHYGFPGHGKN